MMDDISKGGGVRKYNILDLDQWSSTQRKRAIFEKIH